MTDVSIDIQLTPYSETGPPPPTHLLVERKLEPGVILKIGRQVVKEGQVLTKVNEHGLDIWFVSKVVSRHHCEIWNRDNQLYIRDVGSSSGSFLNKMRLSPSGKGSRPYPLKDGDILQFGVDYKGKTEDIFKSIVLKVGFVDQWAQLRRKQANPAKFQTALRSLLLATNPYASSSTPATAEDLNVSTECCICINTIGPYQALFISPCSHCFHFKCVSSILSQSAMFPCPMCRQVANLTASVSMESIADSELKEQVESDSDVSVTVDEQGTAIQGYPVVAPPPVIAAIQPSRPRKLEATPIQFRPQTSQGPSRQPAPPQQTNSRPRSAEEGKHGKSFVAKLSGFLGRKHTNSSSQSASPTAAAGPSSACPESPLCPIESELEINQATAPAIASRTNKSTTSSVHEMEIYDMTVEIEGNNSDRDTDMMQ